MKDALMANPFDASQWSSSEPVEIVAGDFLAWKRTDLHSTYPNTAYTLKYALRLMGAGSTEIEITASASGSEFRVEVASATTANYTVGRYVYQMYITRNSDSERLTLQTGEMKVIANRDTATTNPITHLRTRLENLETAIETLTRKTAASYSIAGRSMSYADLPELTRMRDIVAAELNTKTHKAFGVRA